MHSRPVRRLPVRSLARFITCVAVFSCVSTETNALERTYTADGDVKVIRLPALASAKGWVGRLPQRKRSGRTSQAAKLPASVGRTVAPKFIQSRPLISPPPAPPEEPSSAAQTSGTRAQKSAVRKFEAIQPNSKVPAASGIDKAESKVNQAPKTLKLKLISHNLQKTIELPELPADSAAEEESSETKTEDETSTPPATLGELDLSRPLTNVSLAAALQSTSIKGADLRRPTNQAQTMYSQLGVYSDLPVSHTPGDGQGWSCDYRIFYQPLYFEDPNMERCGRSLGCFTEVASVVRLFWRVPSGAYLIGSTPPRTCVESLGYCPLCYRYGFHAYVPPLNVPGVAAQAAAVVGLVFLIP